MKVFWGLGKLLTLGFWAVVVANMVTALPTPFDLLMSLAGSLVLVIHLFEIVVFNGRVRVRARPWLDRGLILVFGIFHLQSFSSSAAGDTHA